MNDSPTQPEQFIRFSCVKLLLLFAPLAVLVGISLLVNPESWRTASDWVYWVFGGVIVLVCCGCLILPRRYFLHLNSDGLSIQYLTGRRRYSWDEVHNFRVGGGPTVNGMPTGRRVVFDLAENSPQRTTLVEAAAAINGYEVSIFASFGISADDLAELLNEWQQRYATGETIED
jgi:hypothetical protein